MKKEIVQFKQNPIAFAKSIKENIIEGNIKAIQVKAIIDSLNDIMKDVEVKQQLDNEIDLYPEKQFDVNGVKYQKMQKSTYKYDHYDKYVDLKEQLKGIEAQMKSNGEIYDNEGVLIPKAKVEKSDFIKRIK